MIKKNFLILLGLTIFFTFKIFAVENKKITLVDGKKIKLDFGVYGAIVKINENYFTITDNNFLLKLDKNFNILKKVGGKGKGPGEFELISSIDACNDRVIVYDFLLRRLSLFDDNLNFISSLSFDTYSQKINFYQNNKNYIATGIFLDYEKNNVSYYHFWQLKKGKDNLIPTAKMFPIKKKYQKKYAKYFLNDAQITSCRKENSIYLLDSYLPYITVYNMKSNSYYEKNLKFKGDINPLNLNYKKLSKNDYLRKNGLSKLANYNFTYNPILIKYDKSTDIFIAQFLIPFQKQFSDDFKNLYVTVFFDSNFNELSQYESNEKILMIFNEGNSLKFITNRGGYMYKDDADDKMENTLKIKKVLIQ